MRQVCPVWPQSGRSSLPTDATTRQGDRVLGGGEPNSTLLTLSNSISEVVGLQLPSDKLRRFLVQYLRAVRGNQGTTQSSARSLAPQCVPECHLFRHCDVLLLQLSSLGPRHASYFGSRGKGMNPSRFGIFTLGNDWASSTSSVPTIPLRLRM